MGEEGFSPLGNAGQNVVGGTTQNDMLVIFMDITINSLIDIGMLRTPSLLKNQILSLWCDFVGIK